MAAKKTSSKNSAIIDRLLGTSKEPVPQHAYALTQIELIKLLNWYRSYGDDDKLVSYLHVYAMNMKCDVTHLSNTTCTTYGALVRGIENGFVLANSDIKKLNDFCRRNHKVKTKSPVVVQEKPKVQKQVYLTWAEDVESGLDCAITDTPYIHNYETTKTNIKKCVDYIDNLIKVIEVDYKYKDIDKSSYHTQISYLNGLKEYYNVTVKTKSVKRISSNKTTIVKGVKFDNSSKHKFINKPVYPIDIIGKKKLYVYDMKKGKLSLFVSVAEGFTFSGTTIKNINEEKSGSKSFKKTEQLTQQMADLNTLYKDLNRKELAPVTRFNEDTIILAYS